MKKIGILLLIIVLIPFNVLAVSDTQDKLISGAVSEIIFEEDKDKEVAVASMTKMVAQIIILEEIEKGNIKWDQVVTVSKNAADMGGSQIYIQEGEKITIEDLMKGISMASGNDATVQMAEIISGSEDKFVTRMNKKVSELGLKHTHFTNCTGLDQENHYSSAYDMAMIARDLVVNHSEILRFSSLYEDYLRENTKDKFWLVNTNKLVHFYDGADGLKTGHTDAAGYCLAVTAKRNNLRLIGIVLGENDSKIRNTEAMELLDYGFNTVKMNVLKNKGEIIKKVKIDKANKKIVNIALKDDLGVVENIGSKGNYKFESKIEDIKLPLKKGTNVGKINVLNNGKVIATGELIVNENVKSLNFLQLYFRGIKDVVSGNF